MKSLHSQVKRVVFLENVGIKQPQLHVSDDESVFSTSMDASVSDFMKHMNRPLLESNLFTGISNLFGGMICHESNKFLGADESPLELHLLCDFWGTQVLPASSVGDFGFSTGINKPVCFHDVDGESAVTHLRQEKTALVPDGTLFFDIAATTLLTDGVSTLPNRKVDDDMNDFLTILELDEDYALFNNQQIEAAARSLNYWNNYWGSPGSKESLQLDKERTLSNSLDLLEHAAHLNEVCRSQCLSGCEEDEMIIRSSTTVTPEIYYEDLEENNETWGFFVALDEVPEHTWCQSMGTISF